jgi:hypothetical protein
MHGSFYSDEGDKGDVRYRVLGSNFCRAFLSISFIPFIPVILFSGFSHPPTS